MHFNYSNKVILLYDSFELGKASKNRKLHDICEKGKEITKRKLHANAKQKGAYFKYHNMLHDEI